MRGISRAVLARQIAAAITDPACDGQWKWWSEQEAMHARATTSAEAAAAAGPAMMLCSICPEQQRCARRAELDRYTGLAAGAAYCNGKRKSTHPVPRHPEPPAIVAKAG